MMSGLARLSSIAAFSSCLMGAIIAAGIRTILG